MLIRLGRYLRTPPGQTVFLLALCGAVAVAAYLVATHLARNAAVDEARQRALRTLDLQTATLLGQLDKYRHLPAILARREDVRQVASMLERPQTHPRARRIVSDLTALSGAIDSAFISPAGEVVVNATGYFETPMVRSNQLTIAPREGRLGRASISGAGGRRSYAFSSPVRLNGSIIATLAIAAPLESIERAWALSARPIFALNSAGQMVAGNQLARERETPIRLGLMSAHGPPPDTLSLPGDGDFLVFGHEILLLGWTLHVLEPVAPIAAAQASAGLTALLASALAALASVIALRQWHEAARRRRHDRAAAIRLERRVRQRTRELTLANAKLEVEIDERRAAEIALKKAQGELVQSAKLAAIGQMSAALAHEYNQPLAAIRSYADNGRKFIDMGAVGQAAENLDRISGLVDRIAALSRTLRSFARRPRREVGNAVLADVLADAVTLSAPTARNAGIAIEIAPFPQDLAVVAGPVRLSQVLVNLLSNAFDACAQTGGDKVWVEVQQNAGRVSIAIRDSGPGIETGHFEAIFDPFFTTKEVGEGLGLGLSIAYNILRDFGGELKAANAPQGGAVMTVFLAPASAVQAAE